MKTRILLFSTLFVLFSCNNKLYQSYPECSAYYDYIKASWHKKDNGFFWIEEVRDTTEPIWIHLQEGPMFQRQWDKYANECLCQLTEKEVRLLLGEPTITDKVYQVIKEVTIENYGYLISDSLCNDVLPKKNNPYNCSGIGFTFWKGKQDRRYTSKPRLRLYYNYD